ncbi:S24 family peptidase [Caballeronia sp. LZ032]|uniref:XRE family transcriptional regulator n=1 Tax=Caballeronia sp. LZ032 TaxID=3038565 RepID=UPI00286311EE|nr:S24 family peptidase [Caballeronia sp. LZ032]MDR5881091.1 S24 family peptidase [Caballeronia sp. LZ032]
MPAKPLTPSQLKDAKRLDQLFHRWQDQRAAAGLKKSQEVAAGELGIGQSGFSQYLKGKIPLNPDKLMAFSKLFDVRPEEISPQLTSELRDKGLLPLAKETGDVNSSKNAENGVQFSPSTTHQGGNTGNLQMRTETGNVPVPLQYSVDNWNVRRVFVVGRAQGGMPERLWTDGDYPVGATDEFAEIATTDPHAFLSPIVGTSMSPRYNPGEFALVEPGTEPELEDDVLVRLATGETMLKRLISRRGGITLASYNEPGTLLFKEADITWLYYVAHPVPARKIKQRM